MNLAPVGPFKGQADTGPCSLSLFPPTRSQVSEICGFTPLGLRFLLFEVYPWGNDPETAGEAVAHSFQGPQCPALGVAQEGSWELPTRCVDAWVGSGQVHAQTDGEWVGREVSG